MSKRHYANKTRDEETLLLLDKVATTQRAFWEALGDLEDHTGKEYIGTCDYSDINSVSDLKAYEI